MSYIPNTPEEQKQILSSLGLRDMDALYADVPEAVRLKRPLDVGEAKSELEVMRLMEGMAAKNKAYRHMFRGAGAYRHFIPAAVEDITRRNEFVTAYTPYQAEMSQGILQSIFEYQTMICEITGMDVANASVYDGAAAAGEACAMMTERKRHKVLVSAAANPQVIETICTYAAPAGIEIVMLAVKDGLTDIEDMRAKIDDNTAGVYIAQPNYFGLIEDIGSFAAAAHEAKAKLAVGANPTSLGLLKTPGECGADIAVGEGQPLGLPLAFGGPYLGFMAATSAMMRRLPGRIIGQTEDVHGERAFVLTLQAREQHIRREKASSNICSNQAWCALRSAVYMSVAGKRGFEAVARSCYANAHYLKEVLAGLGFLPVYKGDFFHEFVTDCPLSPDALEAALGEKGILCGLPIEEGRMLWCATELTGKEAIDELAEAIKEAVK